MSFQFLLYINNKIKLNQIMYFLLIIISDLNHIFIKTFYKKFTVIYLTDDNSNGLKKS